MNKVLFSVCVLLLLFSDVYGVCTDKNALFSVNATVRYNKIYRGFNVNGNFHSLERYTIIDVYQANVTDLCEGMIKNFPVLESLSMINVNLSKIHPDAFQNVPRLKKLSLAVNKLLHIPKGSFNNMPSLETIYLSENEISSLEEDVFKDMLRLKEIHLDRNRITELNGNIFRGCPQIKIIDFKFNLIKQISKTSFEDIRPEHENSITIFLNRNDIEKADDLYFDITNPVNLHLEGNRIRQLSSIFYKLKDKSRLYLNNNIISCVSDDIVENMENSAKELYVLNNPITCDCSNRMDRILQNEMYEKETLYYSSTFNCEFLNSVIFDRK